MPPPQPGLFFIRVSRMSTHKATAAELLGHLADLASPARDPDDDGREWVDVAFDRDDAETLARRWTGTDDADDEISTVAEVVSIGELLTAGGYAAAGRALAAVESALLGRIEQLKAGVPLDSGPPPGSA